MALALVVVMGVSGCGKSMIGRLLAEALALPYLEGDDLHSPENVERMRTGHALTDEQRRDWLEALSARLARARRDGQGLVVSCSALKRAYRDVLRRGAPQLRLVHLKAERALLADRSAKRQGHYMPLSLLDSQFATLEPPDADEAALTYDVSGPPSEIVLSVMASLAAQPRTDTALSFQEVPSMSTFTKVVLFTDTDGRARFREESVALTQGSPQAMLSSLFASGGYQLRQSPVGFRSQFHCTGAAQWLFVLRGQMEIGLQDGTSRVFGPGDHFYSTDQLPEGATFDPALHGHWSRQVGPDPLVTLFVRG